MRIFGNLGKMKNGIKIGEEEKKGKSCCWAWVKSQL